MTNRLANSNSWSLKKHAENRFPMIPYTRLTRQGDRLLDSAPNQDGLEATEAPIEGRYLARQRALSLVKGGIFDHVAGGFHRYTVDHTWAVPHFEKRLYDNGLILEFLAECWQNGEQAPAIARAVDKTVDWLTREMRSPAGFFYAAQDADNFTEETAIEPAEGGFYTWSQGELQRLLTAEELAEIETLFTVSEAGNFEGKNVLQRTDSNVLTASAETALDKLFRYRYGSYAADTPIFEPAIDAQSAKGKIWPGRRIPPVTDTKMIVAWTALMMSGLAKAATAFDRKAYLVLAIETAGYIQQYQQVNGSLYRLNDDGQVGVVAQAEDYALLIKALLDIQQACLWVENYRPLAADWLEVAIALQAQFDQALSADQGGYSNAANEQLIVQEHSHQDSAVLSANGVAIASLIRLFLLTENLDYLTQAETALKSFSSVLTKAPDACPNLRQALDWFTHPLLIRTTPSQIAHLREHFLPTVMLKVEDTLPSGAVAILCQGLKCLTPATDFAMLNQQIEKAYGTR